MSYYYMNAVIYTTGTFLNFTICIRETEPEQSSDWIRFSLPKISNF